MNPVQRYWMTESKKINLDFEGFRKAATDSDVKGGGNESIVANLLSKNFATRQVVVSTQVIDAYDKQSDEVDVVICNRYQPFNPGSTQPLLIAEGVDAVIQVKAWLDKGEIKRAFSNAATVKQLVRTFAKHDSAVGAADGDFEHFINRIPYFCFAFATSTSDETLLSHIMEEATNCSAELQPDGFFILEKSMFLNMRDNSTSLLLNGVSGGWAHSASADHTLPLMLRYLYRITPEINRVQHPVLFYPVTPDLL
uniref:DUF6602 domain-containing protein n=1 Tax=Paractinoplanes polyasparticus TaxID=2856853 RepID=UPI001C86499B|nr:DUF6602 domain-containing protein [Actinoplanes polyasparticus]